MICIRLEPTISFTQLLHDPLVLNQRFRYREIISIVNITLRILIVQLSADSSASTLREATSVDNRERLKQRTN